MPSFLVKTTRTAGDLRPVERCRACVFLGARNREWRGGGGITTHERLLLVFGRTTKRTEGYFGISLISPQLTDNSGI